MRHSLPARPHEAAERTRLTGVSVNVCYPGKARTRMTGSMTRDMLRAPLRLAWPGLNSS